MRSSRRWSPRHLFAIQLGAAALLLPTGSYAANPHGDLRIEPIAAYNFVVDSNIESPSGYGPDSAALGAHICNDGADDLTDVLVNIGNHNPDGVNDGLNPANPDPAGIPTPGIFPVEDVNEVANSWLYTGEFSFTLESPLSDGTRYLPYIPAGECITQYWLVTYPNLDANGDAVFGAGSKLTDDLVIEYDIWVSADDNGTALAADATYSGTMRNEISASANKISPNNAAKVPEEYLSIIQSELGWRPLNTAVEAGTGGLVEGIWYDLGNVNKGFDNDGDLIPDYNLWLQPIGDASRFDSACFRLISVRGLLIVKRNNGINQLIQVEDQLYFQNIPENNTGVVGLIYYEWMPVEGGCSGELTPYQEAASGSENEKFNADFGSLGAIVSTANPNIEYLKTVLDPATHLPFAALPLPGGTLEYSLSAQNLEDPANGLEYGSPSAGAGLVLRDSIPAGTEYVVGSADSGNTLPAGVAANTLFSVDGGITWMVDEPLAAAAVTNIQWHLSEPLAAGETATATFQTTIPTNYSGVTVDNCAEAAIGTGNKFAEACKTLLIGGNNSLSGTVFLDDGAGGGSFADGTRNGTEAGISAIAVSLYVDQNGDGLLDGSDLFLDSVDSNALTGDYSFASLPDGSFLVVVDAGDTDLPAGTGLTTPPEIAVALDPGGAISTSVDVPDNDFGFAPPLSIDKTLPTPVYEGQEITYSIGVTNHLLPGVGTTAVECAYEGWAHDTPDTDTNALGAPDGVYSADHSGNNQITGGGFAITPSDPSQTIIKVELVGYLYLTGSIGDDALGRAIAHDDTTIVSLLSHAADGVGAYIDNSDPPVAKKLTWDITSDWDWNWADFAGTSHSTGLRGHLYFDKVGGATISGIYVDAIGVRITIAECGGGPTDPESAMWDVRLVDSYDPAKLEFVSASITPDTATSTTLTWNDIGPIEAQQTKSVEVRFKVLHGNAGLSINNHAGITDSSFYNGNPGNTPEVDVAFTLQPAGSISGVVWSEGSGTDGWVGTTGYESLGATDFGVPNVAVDLYACAWDGDYSQVIDSGDPNLANDAGCTSQSKGSGQSSQNGVWTLIRSTTTDDTGAYSFYGLTDNGFYTVEVDSTSLPGTVAQTAEANDSQSGGGYSCASTPADFSCDHVWGVTAGSSGSGNSTDPGDLSASWFNTLDPAGGEDITNVNFGYTVSPALFGNVWEDLDGDGVQDPGDNPFSGWTVSLNGTGCTPCMTTTDVDGDYEFVNLSMGTYTVTVTTPSGATWNQTFETGDQTPDRSIDVALVSSKTSGSWDFAFTQTGSASVGDTIFYDFNGDGTQQAGDEGIAGVTVSLYENEDGDRVVDVGVDALIGTTTTAANGNYSFTNLPPGGYTVVVDQSSTALNGTHQTADPDETGVTCITCDGSGFATVVGTASDLTEDFGYQLSGRASIGDTVFRDTNGDGIQRGSEVGIANIRVELWADLNNDGAFGLVATTTTDGNGNYLFENVPANGALDYQVKVDAADADLPMTATGSFYVPTTPTTHGVSNLAAKTSYLDADFGFAPLGAIGHTVYWDTNINGSQDPGEPGIAGVTLTLSGGPSCTTPCVTTTDASGTYLFSDLVAGSYTATVSPGTGNLGSEPQTGDPNRDGVACWDTTYPALQTPENLCDHAHTVPLGVGSVDLSADFGYQPSGVIGDRVWRDLNNDGVQDPGEVGVAGVTVTLTPPAGVNLGNGDGGAVTTTTDADGLYSFIGIPDATGYIISVTPPANHSTTYDIDGGTGVPDSSTTFNMGGGKVDLDAGNTWCGAAPADCALGLDFGYDLSEPNSLSGNVCLDDPAKDGQCAGTGGETQMEDQLVYLRNLGADGVQGGGDDLLIGFTPTTPTGDYSFDGLPDGKYAVVVGTTAEPISLAKVTTTATNPNHPDVDSVTDAGASIAQVVDVDFLGDQSALTIADVDFAFYLDVLLDFGDLPSNYPTELADNGAAHIVDALDPVISLGGGVTNETDGQPDPDAAGDTEEDGIGFTGMAAWTEGTVANGKGGSIGVTFQGASSSQPTVGAWLVGWIDFNGDGDFLDTGEMIVDRQITDTDASDASPVTLNMDFDVPAGTRMTGSYYSRFRLFRSRPGVSLLASTGTVTGGEVEDYRVPFNWDYGDAPESYSTSYDNDGPRHLITAGLHIGSPPDVEDEGQAVAANANNSGANGDGSDEDGVSNLKFFKESVESYGASMNVAVTNTLSPAKDAQLVCWIDFNQNGSFLDAGERSSPTISATDACFQVDEYADGTFTTGNVPPGCSGTATVSWSGLSSVPAAGSNVYSRCRLTTESSFFSDSSPEPTGPAADGEIEDNLNDAPAPTAVTIGSVGLESASVSDLLSETDGAFLRSLLASLDPALAAALADASDEELRAALRDYLDPDGDGNVAVLRWDTLEERGTIGFYVERQEAGDSWRQLNGGDMLPGMITAPMGAEYWLVDPEAQSAVDYLYRLIEQEAWGSTRTYGPFELRME